MKQKKNNHLLLVGVLCAATMMASNPAAAQSVAEVCGDPITVEPGKWTMLSIPCNSSPLTLTEQINEEDLGDGAIQGRTWRMMRLSNTGRWVSVQPDEELAAGGPYLFYSRRAASLEFTGDYTSAPYLEDCGDYGYPGTECAIEDLGSVSTFYRSRRISYANPYPSEASLDDIRLVGCESEGECVELGTVSELVSGSVSGITIGNVYSYINGRRVIMEVPEEGATVPAAGAILTALSAHASVRGSVPDMLIEDLKFVTLRTDASPEGDGIEGLYTTEAYHLQGALLDIHETHEYTTNNEVIPKMLREGVVSDIRMARVVVNTTNDPWECTMRVSGSSTTALSPTPAMQPDTLTKWDEQYLYYGIGEEKNWDPAAPENGDELTAITGASDPLPPWASAYITSAEAAMWATTGPYENRLNFTVGASQTWNVGVQIYAWAHSSWYNIFSGDDAYDPAALPKHLELRMLCVPVPPG